MHFVVRINNTDLAEAFRSYVERRLRFALGRFGGRVGQVTVSVAAADRADHHCHISAEILPFGRVEVEESGSDLFSAIDRAAGRIGRLFGRELKRARDARFGLESIRLAA